MFGQLRSLEAADLRMILDWRNHPDVRKNMYTTHEISWQEHQAWFARVQADPSKRYFIYEDAGEPLGLVGFVDYSQTSSVSSFGFYSGDLARRGLGSRMEFCALDHAFMTMGLNKLHCEVLDFNQAVIKLHLKFGFLVEGIFKEHHSADGVYHDVYRLANFRKWWLAAREPIAARLTRAQER